MVPSSRLLLVKLCAKFWAAQRRLYVHSSKKVGAVGARIDVPIKQINASYIRNHFDSMEVGLNGAPLANELLYVFDMITGARIHSRSG